MNMLVMVLDNIGSIGRFNFKIALIPFIIAWVLIIGLGLGISMKYDKIEEPVETINQSIPEEPNENIVEVQ